MKSRKYWQTLLATALFAGSILAATPAYAEIKTYEGVGEYVMSDFETPDVAKQRAKARAEQSAQEQAGVFVNSYTKVNNLQVTDDEVIVIASGIMSITDTVYEHSSNADGFVFRAKIKANIDTNEINKWLEKGVQERSAMAAQNKELKAAIEEQNKEIANLKKQLATKNSETNIEKLRTEIAAADNVFLGNQKIEAGNKLYFNGDYRGAVASYTEAINLNPASAIAYRYRGTSYANVQDYDSAAIDFSKSIELAPNQAAGYVGRGAANIYLKRYQQAASDLTKAIELAPNDAMAYYNRGICYQALGDMTSAHADFNKAEALGYR